MLHATKHHVWHRVELPMHALDDVRVVVSVTSRPPRCQPINQSSSVGKMQVNTFRFARQVLAREPFSSDNRASTGAFVQAPASALFQLIAVESVGSRFTTELVWIGSVCRPLASYHRLFDQNMTIRKPILRRFTLLRHQVGSQFDRVGLVADAAVHWDWLFDRSGEPEFKDSHPLMAWASLPLEVPFGSHGKSDQSMAEDWELTFHMERLANHRAKYLDFDGDIGGERGSVSQVLSSDYLIVHEDEHEFSVDLVLPQSAYRLVMLRTAEAWTANLSQCRRIKTTD